jgi:gentisate 1,2-dioxygenase
MIWFDGLDVPLVRNLDAVFFEPGGEELSPYEPALASRSEALYGGAGLLPASEERFIARDPAPGQPSRLLAYRWAATDATLSRLIGSAGRRAASVRYSDPATGRDIMPTLRAELHRVLAGHRTPTTRTAGSGIWVVFRGSGATVVDGRRFRWTAGDMLVTPSWAAVDHEATDDADLFLLSDGPVLEALGLARTRELPPQDVREDVA